MLKMEAALNTYNAFHARRQAKDAAKFSETYPDITDFCGAIEEWLNSDD